MVQKKYFLIIAGSLVLVAAAGVGGFVFWHGRQHTVASLGSGSAFGSSQDQANAGYSNGQNIPLTPSPTDSSGGLSTDSSPAAGNLGQLSNNQNSPGSGSGSSGSSTSSGGSSASQGIDPSTFSQYDKYKTATNTLFGDVQVGTGTELTSGQHQVSVYYKGWLTNGTLFDESHTGSDGKLQPFTFTFGASPPQVITGWEQGLAGMKVGGTRLLVIPPSVGYGASGQGPIPGNAVLVFEVQLVAVQ